MKVLVVGTGAGLVSGITSATEQAATTLESMGHQVDRVEAGNRLRRRPRRLNPENVAAVLRDAAAVRRAAKENESDLAWVHSFGVPTGPALRALALVAAARSAHVPVVLSIHAYGIDAELRAGGRLLDPVLRALGWLASTITVLYSGAVDVLAAHTRTTPMVLANWVDVPDDPEPLPQGPPWRVVFVGTLIARKGVSELLAAMRLLDDVPVQLRLVGGPGEDGEDAVESYERDAADLVAAGRVAFVGPLDPSGVRTELRQAHIFVLPSHAEGTPMALLEAMAVGRPVVVSDAGNMAEVVAAAACGVVLREVEPETIADGLRAAIVEADRDAPRAHRAALDRHSERAARTQIDELLGAASRR